MFEESAERRVMIRMEDAERDQARRCSRHFTDVARRCGAEILDSSPCRSATACNMRSGTCWCYGPLRNVLGMSRIRIAYTAGAAIGLDLFASTGPSAST